MSEDDMSARQKIIQERAKIAVEILQATYLELNKQNITYRPEILAAAVIAAWLDLGSHRLEQGFSSVESAIKAIEGYMSL